MTQEDCVIVSRSAIDWLKKHYPQLCVKAGLCERVAGRLYTKTFGATGRLKAEQQEPVEATPYNLKRIAWELERTAVGDGFYGNALRVAKDMPGTTPKDRSVLDRYATGTQTGTDHVHLQWLALRLYNKDDSKNGVQT